MANLSVTFMKMRKHCFTHFDVVHMSQIMGHVLVGVKVLRHHTRLVLITQLFFSPIYFYYDILFQWMNFNETLLRAKNLGSGLISLGLQPGPSTLVGIYAQNRPEWIIFEQV